MVIGPCRLSGMGRCVALGLLAIGFAFGCDDRQPQVQVVVYCSVDEPFARDVLARFEARTGIRVRALFDAEAGKTTGLVRKIQAERRKPRADVFWSSELFRTILLAREGLLARYRSAAAADIPERYKDPRGYWTAIGLRARVLAFDTRRLSREQVPRRWQDLAEARWAGKFALADPRFGTTAGHVAAMFALWGRAPAERFLRTLRGHDVMLAAGNAHAVRVLLAGQVAICATDTDDVWVAQRRGEPVDLVYPDMGDGGTLLIPNAISILAGCQHPEQARRLVDFLVSADVERMLARSDSRNIPVRPWLREQLGLSLPPQTQIGYPQIAAVMEQAVASATAILVR